LHIAKVFTFSAERPSVSVFKKISRIRVKSANNVFLNTHTLGLSAKIVKSFSHHVQILIFFRGIYFFDRFSEKPLFVLFSIKCLGIESDVLNNLFL